MRTVRASHGDLVYTVQHRGKRFSATILGQRCVIAFKHVDDAWTLKRVMELHYSVTGKWLPLELGSNSEDVAQVYVVSPSEVKKRRAWDAHLTVGQEPLLGLRMLCAAALIDLIVISKFNVSEDRISMRKSLRIRNTIDTENAARYLDAMLDL